MINLPTVTVRHRLVNKETGGPAADDFISSILISICCEISCPSSDKLHFEALSGSNSEPVALAETNYRSLFIHYEKLKKEKIT